MSFSYRSKNCFARVFAAALFLTGLILGGCSGEELAGLPPLSEGGLRPEFKQEIFKPRYNKIDEYYKQTLLLMPLQREMPPVAPGNWRFFWKEPQQSPQQYMASFPVTVNKLRSTLYVCRVGDFDAQDNELYEKTVEYLSVCFQCPVSQAADIPLSSFPVTARRRGEGRREQINSVYLTDKLLKPTLPEDGWGIFALTAHDIYKAEGLSRQYGDSLVFGRAAVLSIYHLKARAAPLFMH